MVNVIMFQPVRFAGKPQYKTMVPLQGSVETEGIFEVYTLTKVDFVKLYSAETGEEIAVEVVGDNRVKVVGSVESGCECYGIAVGDSLERTIYLQALRELEKAGKAEPVKSETE